jgi:NADH:ubiquinone oxidoreductase subunit 2 (subunit N)
MTLVGRIIFGVSQTSLFARWVILEINMLAFLALVRFNLNNHLSAPIKYFMVQRIGSSVFLLGFRLISLTSMSIRIQSMGRLGLFLKLGAAPFHG